MLASTAWQLTADGLFLPAGTVGLIGLLNPLTGVLLGVAVAGEVLTVQQLCGLVLVVVGVVLAGPCVRAGATAVRRLPGPAPIAAVLAVRATARMKGEE